MRIAYTFSFFLWLRVLVKAEYSAVESTLNSPIVSYRIYAVVGFSSCACADFVLRLFYRLTPVDSAFPILQMARPAVGSSLATWQPDDRW